MFWFFLFFKHTRSSRVPQKYFCLFATCFFCKHMGASCGCIHVSTHHRFNIVPHFRPFSSVCNNIQQVNSGRPIWQNSCIALEWKIKESLDSAKAVFLENNHWYPRTTVFLFLRIITICQKRVKITTDTWSQVSFSLDLWKKLLLILS